MFKKFVKAVVKKAVKSGKTKRNITDSLKRVELKKNRAQNLAMDFHFDARKNKDRVKNLDKAASTAKYAGNKTYANKATKLADKAEDRMDKLDKLSDDNYKIRDREYNNYKRLKNLQYKRTIQSLKIKTGITAGVASAVTVAGAATAIRSNQRKRDSITIGGKTITDKRIGIIKTKLADGYKYVYGKVRRVRG